MVVDKGEPKQRAKQKYVLRSFFSPLFFPRYYDKLLAFQSFSLGSVVELIWNDGYVNMWVSCAVVYQEN